MKKTKHIEDRIRDAFNGRTSMNYHVLFDLVYPQDEYPKAHRYSSNGGPPGGSMALSAALRRMGGGREYAKMDCQAWIPRLPNAALTGAEGVRVEGTVSQNGGNEDALEIQLHDRQH